MSIELKDWGSLGLLCIIIGAFIWSYAHFHPQAFSPRISLRAIHWICLFLIIGGALSVVFVLVSLIKY